MADSVGIPTEKRCEECNWKMVWSTKQDRYIHTYNTKPECPVIRRRSNG